MKLVYYDVKRQRTVIAESDNPDELLLEYIKHKRSHFIYSPSNVKIPDMLPAGGTYTLRRDDVAGYEYAVEN